MTLLQVGGLAKRYGAVQALTRVDLLVNSAEVHAVVGANGAGKSTLVKILSGVERPTAGTVVLRDRQVLLNSPAAARAAGLGPVFQDPALIGDLSVAENLALTGTDRDKFGTWMDRLEINVDAGGLVSTLPLPVIRIVELAGALAHDPELLVLDEITAALPPDISERVFRVMATWRERGRSVLFISHRLGEVAEHCDRVTVLRDGRDVGQIAASTGSEKHLLELMLGPVAAGSGSARARATSPQPSAGKPGHEPRVALETRGLVLRPQNPDGLSFTLHAGEILGVAALDDQGQEELFAFLSGTRKPRRGDMLANGQRLTPRSPYDAIRRGIVLVPADRSAALLPQRSVMENLAFPRLAPPRRWGIVNRHEEEHRVAATIQRLEIDVRAQNQVRRLSGGNQQKVSIGRWLVAGFQTLLCFDPTRGIDIHTKTEIHRLLRELAADGIAILLFTSEFAEIPLVCDRVIVLHHGAIIDELPAADADEARLLHAAHGLGRREEEEAAR